MPGIYFYDPEMPFTRSGCLWYFVGLCLFALLSFAFVEWMR